jgi:polyphenol oxidase
MHQSEILTNGYLLCQKLKDHGVLAGTTLRYHSGRDFNMSRTHAESESAYFAQVDRWLSDFTFNKLYSSNRAFFLHLTHGTEVLTVDTNTLNSHSSSSFIAQTDGAVTSLHGADSVVLTVKSSDCLPVFLFCPVTRASGIVHCGWRGLSDGILTNACNALFAIGAGRSLIAHIGVGISAAKYQVNQDVAERFPGSCITVAGATYLDLSAAATRALTEIGLNSEDISRSNYCTFGDSQLFYSYRRDGFGGSMLSFINVS